MILTGKTICPGIARGPTHVIDARALLASAARIRPLGGAPAEVERLHAAIGRACVELDRVQRQLSGRVQATDVAIFESHAGLLRDAQFVDRVERTIREEGESAESAVARVVNELYAAFIANPVPLVQDKASDILDIGRRLIQCLSASLRAETEFDKGAVIVAASLTPSQLVRFAHQGAAAAVTETCGARSHTAILARGLGLPLVTGLADACERIADGATAIVDATHGQVVIDASPDEEDRYRGLLEDEAAAREGDESPADPPVTLDGIHIRLLLNISDPLEAGAVSLLGSDGVGLFRTEFGYMDRAWWPTSDECYEIFREVARQAGPGELNIRLVDFGAEKCPPYADIPVNRNPGLGLRGMRLLLQRDDILQPQVKALARLGAERPVTVLLPMLDTLDTLDATIDRLCRTVGCVSREQLPFRLGAMIEIPSAALSVDEFLTRVDSLSIGLNDLTQYLLAADRDDEYVERYHDAMQPAVLRLLDRVVQSAHRAGRPLTICGELAGDPKLTGLLLALGVRRLSVARASYRPAIEAIRRLSLRSLEGIGPQVLALSTAAAVRQYVSEKFGAGPAAM